MTRSRPLGDVQPILAAIAKTAARLCDANDAVIRLVEGDQTRLVARYGRLGTFRKLGETSPLTADLVAHRSIVERRTIHIHDLAKTPRTRFRESKAGHLPQGRRTMLATPLLRDGVAIGAILIRRTKVRPFTPKQIALLRTFANQAAIAIENARLSQALEARNAELSEALEQQTATSEVLKVISRSTFDLMPVLQTLIESASRLCEATHGTIYRPDGEVLRASVHYGGTPEFIEYWRRTAIQPGRGSGAGRAALERSTVHIADVMSDAEYRLSEAQRLGNIRTLLCVPMLREGILVGVFSMWRTEARPFSDKQIDLVTTFADQAVIAIENVRLFTELESRNGELRVALEQQTATSELLKVIGQSTFDLQPVFETLAENAVRLCEAERGLILRFDGQLLRFAVGHNVSPELREFFERNPIALGRNSNAGRAALERRTVHNHDVLSDPEYNYGGHRVDPYRTVLAIPMLRADELLGVIIIYRHEVRPFSDSHIALMETFADQASIAIENARLLSELQAKNADLTEALEQQTATSEILRVISSSPTDVQPVFAAILEQAAGLCGAQQALLWLHEGGEQFRLGAAHGARLDYRNWLIGQLHCFGRPFFRPDGPWRVGHIEDVRTTEPYRRGDPIWVRTADQEGMRTMLGVPLVKEGRLLGSIAVYRREVQPFTDAHIALIKTFAEQAGIAIENVRLFKELEARNRDLTVALEQQTATSEILRVISSSQTDVQPVFDTIVRSAVRLCDGLFSALYQFDGELIHQVAQHNFTPEALEEVHRIFPARPSRALASGRAILECEVVHIPDVEADPEYQHQSVARAIGFRSGLFVPMLWEGAPIGVIVVARAEAGPFSDNEIELLKTFADQAAIAVENVRLFKELEARNHDLTEALEQTTATSEILRVISSSPTDIQPVLDTVAESAARLCESFDSAIWRRDGDRLLLVAHHGPIPIGPIGKFTLPLVRGTVGGRSVLDGRTIHVTDLQTDVDEFPESSENARRMGFRTILCVPLTREGVAIGAIQLRRTEAQLFTERQVALLQTFADQAVIAVENVRLFKELEARNRDLTAALEQQTATSEILRVISSSPMDVQPTFEAIAAAATTLCGAENAGVFLFDGRLIHFAAHHHWTAEDLDAIRRVFPRPPGRGSVTARAILTRVVAHVPDLTKDPEYEDTSIIQAGFRAVLSVPMLRDGQPIGAINVTRREPVPFSDTQIALLETFASQAVIAVENVRLFKELQARTGELTQSVEKLTALGEVSQALSSTLDVETVLNTIVSHASQLAGAAGCSIYEYDEAAEQFELRATHNYDARFVEALRAAPLRKGEGLMGRATEMREPAQIPDITEPGAYQSNVRDTLMRFGYRALLSVPLLREEQIIGSLSLTRKTPGEFSPEVIDVLKTFATQSALAIQNARLFREIADKSRQLEVASRHKSEFLANMSHELRTPLNAIIGFSEVLNERMFGELNPKQEEYLKDIHASGQHLLSLINDILDLSKIEAGRMELELTDFDLPAAMDNAVTLVRERASRKGVTVRIAVGDQVGATRGDERKIRQVLLNLLSNAIKFTPEGGCIEVAAVQDDGAVEVSVSDTGVGIAPEDQEAVFEEFRQVGASAAKQEGTGLGLALCRKFIELHGGAIWVTSTVGAGSTFTFRLPT